MPLTSKGEKILSEMEGQYGEKKGEQVFYASKNAGKISGVDMNNGIEGLKTYGDKMSEGSEGLKSYEEDARHRDDAHHHEFEGETGPEIEDKRRDAGMGLVQAQEEPEAKKADYPKSMDTVDSKFTHQFPNDPFGDNMPDGGFQYEKVWSASEMKNSPFAIYKE